MRGKIRIYSSNSIIFAPVSSQIVVIKQHTAAMNSSVQELYPLTDVYLNKALLRISATFLPCGALLVSHLQKYQINAVENDRCYG